MTTLCGYPVNVTDSVTQLLRYAQANEYKEHDEVYKAFAQIAEEEGFSRVAADFKNIAKIERVHGDRFAELADLLEQEKLFLADAECGWMCLNCGHIHIGTQAPPVCPACKHAQGYFVRVDAAEILAPKN